MINEQEIFSKIHLMPENLKSEILDYVDFLFKKYSLNQDPKHIFSSVENIDNKKIFGSLKGFVKYMSDDFDEPLEDFKEYM